MPQNPLKPSGYNKSFGYFSLLSENLTMFKQKQNIKWKHSIIYEFPISHGPGQTFIFHC